MFAHGTAFQIDFVRIVNQTVHNGIGQGWTPNDVVPVLKGSLTGRQSRTVIMSVLENLQQVAAIVCGQSDQTPVIQNQYIGFGEPGQEPGVASIAIDNDRLLKDSGQTQVQGRIAFPTGFLCQGTGTNHNLKSESGSSKLRDRNIRSERRLS